MVSVNLKIDFELQSLKNDSGFSPCLQGEKFGTSVCEPIIFTRSRTLLTLRLAEEPQLL